MPKTIDELLTEALKLCEELKVDLTQIKASLQQDKASNDMYQAAKHKAGIH